jgi:predicted esterase
VNFAALSHFFVLRVLGCSSNDVNSTEPERASGGTPGTGGAEAVSPARTGGENGEPDGSAGAPSGGASGTATRAAGCDDDLSDTLGEWVQQTPLTVDGAERVWWAWFPTDYDPERAYPVIFLFHGCGDETNNLPLETYAGRDAILVRGLADGADGCWLTASETNSEFFNAMLDSLSDKACADSDSVFAVGYDSGAELVSRLGCYQAYLIDAVATVAGSNALFEGATCSGPVAAMMIHDTADTEQDITENEEVRDRLIEQNFCVADGFAEPVEPAPCVQYSGCGDPVLWCATTGEGHDRQDAYAAPAIWDFFSSR